MIDNLAVGPALRRAWIGYRLALDAEIAAAGFADSRLPDGRVLRICLRSSDTTISQIGRELGITRQGASKLVASLRERGYVTLTRSASDRREKAIALTPRAHDYLAAHRQGAHAIEARLRENVGVDSFEALQRLLTALDAPEQPRLRDYLRTASHADISYSE